MMQVKRIIDANANRVREALRVMEEAARFLLNNKDLCSQIKSMRHDFAAAISQIPNLESQRDTTGDVGTSVCTAREYERSNTKDVAIAAGKRLSEALRAIEEYGKVLGPVGVDLVRAVEQLRYRGYTVEQSLNIALSYSCDADWQLCLLLTRVMCEHHTWEVVLKEAIKGGVDCVQIREKEAEGGLSGRALVMYCKEVVKICHAADVAVIVNDRADVAMMCGADGVHVGQQDVGCDELRNLFGGQMLVGVSTSCIAEAELAWEMGASYCGVGPMFATTTKDKKVIVGPKYLNEYGLWGKLPGLAIGGIEPSEEKLEALRGAGMGEEGMRLGMAVSGVICRSEKPGEVAADLKSLFNG
ncbi:Thiamine-phosphate synthase [Poriferisphaera corsica]|uniref:Thiamine-phosphate synthase n=1 Tax=Poriferisphaera corsica TaxID=2528020 RepID=A0A517YWB1_9BACT|nr:thiamine phosphate synthase [Poriferisphaera corsica]QDU34525.1 Thiamine-phosphate synthase [Poriferisphaera corsica]